MVQGKLPVNHAIVYQLQDIFNLLPDVTDQQFVKCMHTKTNDQMLVVYLASLTRSVIALHNLINNKLTNKEAEKKEATGKKEDKEKKDEKEKEKAEDKIKKSKK